MLWWGASDRRWLDNVLTTAFGALRCAFASLAAQPSATAAALGRSSGATSAPPPACRVGSALEAGGDAPKRRWWGFVRASGASTSPGQREPGANREQEDAKASDETGDVKVGSGASLMRFRQQASFYGISRELPSVGAPTCQVSEWHSDTSGMEYRYHTMTPSSPLREPVARDVELQTPSDGATGYQSRSTSSSRVFAQSRHPSPLPPSSSPPGVPLSLSSSTVSPFQTSQQVLENSMFNYSGKNLLGRSRAEKAYLQVRR